MGGRSVLVLVRVVLLIAWLIDSQGPIRSVSAYYEVNAPVDIEPPATAIPAT